METEAALPSCISQREPSPRGCVGRDLEKRKRSATCQAIATTSPRILLLVRRRGFSFTAFFDDDVAGQIKEYSIGEGAHETAKLHGAGFLS